MKIIVVQSKPNDILEDLQELIEEEPDTYLNSKRCTLCTALAYLNEYFTWYRILEDQIPPYSEENRAHSVEVLLFTKNKQMIIGYYVYPVVLRTGKRIPGRWFACLTGNVVDACITHWTYLPPST